MQQTCHQTQAPLLGPCVWPSRDTMASRSLVLLLLVTAMAAASAQLQTGVLYWCMTPENGPNFLNSESTESSPSQPGVGWPFGSTRAHYQASPSNTRYWSGVCHVQDSQSSDVDYMLSNGTTLQNTAPYNVDNNVAPTRCQTADNWGTDGAQCMYPGFGKPQLFITGDNGQPAPTSYPVTYDQKSACNMVVFTSDLRPLVNANVWGSVAKLFVWKDYADTMYVTVSINASLTPDADQLTSGQQLYMASPSAIDYFPSVGVYVSANYPNSLTFMTYGYTSTSVLASSYQFWTCFTMPIPLTQVCDSSNSVYVRDVGCRSLSTNQIVPYSNLAGSPNLFFSIGVNLTLLSTGSAGLGDRPCGNISPGFIRSLQTYIGSLGGATKVLDLYSNNGIVGSNALPRNCAALAPPSSSPSFRSPRRSRSPPSPSPPPACQIVVSVVKITTATQPFSLFLTDAPFPFNNDGNKFTNLFNQLYSGGVTASYPGPVFVSQNPSTGFSTTLNVYGGIIGPQAWPAFFQNFVGTTTTPGSGSAPANAMAILAGAFGLTCADQVWANISACPGIADARIVYTGFQSPSLTSTRRTLGATQIIFNQGISVCFT